jgi:signal transduction histidine kinase
MDSRSVFDGIKRFVPWAVALATAGIFLRAEAVTAETVSLGDRMARWLSPDVRKLGASLDDIEGRLLRCPRLSVRHQLQRLGCRSWYLESADQPVVLVVDLAQIREIDAIAMIPVHLVQESSAAGGYGFPTRFRLDIADDQNFDTFETVVDFSQTDCPAPGDYPFYYPFEPRSCRYVRLSVQELSKAQSDLWVFALAELIVLSGNRNVALGRPVRASGILNSPPTWSLENVVDGQSGLGLPVSSERSPTNGYSSEFSDEQDSIKWVQIDLGQVLSIDEIRVIPGQPVDWADRQGFGFPSRFRLELSLEAAFQDGWMAADHTTEDYPNPGDNAVVVPTHGRDARYVRVTATRLFAKKTPGTPGACLLALAELQVYSGGRNVALGVDVQSLDSFHFEPRPLWEREFLVDGYSSQNQLIEFPDWLAGLDRRRQLEASRKSLTLRREATVQNTLTGATVFSGVVVVLVIAGASVAFRRGRRRQKRELLQLRAQIARDLHDDIGSSIGSIRLLSEMAQDTKSLPEQAKKDLVEIHQIAGETTNAIRDIVWLIGSESQPHGELITRMQQVCDSMLGGLDVTFQVEAKSARPVVDVPIYRNVLFAFKEVLNNVIRHAGAKRVVIEVEQSRDTLHFSVRDDGCGFDTDQLGAGNGLRNLDRRAETLGGSVCIDSEIGRGTTVRFRAKLT